MKVSKESIENLKEELKTYDCFTDKDIKEIVFTLHNMNHQIQRLEEGEPIQIKLAFNPDPIENIEQGDMVGLTDEWETFFVEVIDDYGDDLYVGEIKNCLLSYEYSDNLVPYSLGDKIFFEKSNVIYGQI